MFLKDGAANPEILSSNQVVSNGSEEVMSGGNHSTPERTSGENLKFTAPPSFVYTSAVLKENSVGSGGGSEAMLKTVSVKGSTDQNRPISKTQASQFREQHSLQATSPKSVDMKVQSVLSSQPDTNRRIETIKSIPSQPDSADEPSGPKDNFVDQFQQIKDPPPQSLTTRLEANGIKLNRTTTLKSNTSGSKEESSNIVLAKVGPYLNSNLESDVDRQYRKTATASF